MSRKTGIQLLLIVVCFVIVGAIGRPDDPTGKGSAELQGCWKLVSVETNGNADDPIGGGEPRWVIKGDTVYYGGVEIIRFTADTTTSPHIIDLKFRDPERIYEGIYVVEKDTLKVCLNSRADAKDRPGVFSSQDQLDWRLFVFQKEKVAPANPVERLTAFAGIQLRVDPDTKAVVVDTPIKGSPAEKAGLKKGDVILKVGGTAVTGIDAAVKLVRQTKVGDKLDFRISREGKEEDIIITLGVFPFHWTAGLQ
jgi:uncharacterized protein (TIGR03067 family)